MHYCSYLGRPLAMMAFSAIKILSNSELSLDFRGSHIVERYRFQQCIKISPNASAPLYLEQRYLNILPWHLKGFCLANQCFVNLEFSTISGIKTKPQLVRRFSLEMFVQIIFNCSSVKVIRSKRNQR